MCRAWYKNQFRIARFAAFELRTLGQASIAQMCTKLSIIFSMDFSNLGSSTILPKQTSSQELTNENR